MKKIELTARDREILSSLWKWKMLTSTGICSAFFMTRDASIGYRRLRRLKLAKFIKWTPLDAAENGGVWTLTKKGYHKVRENLPCLSANGFLSENLVHDAYVTAVHVGDWLVTRPPKVELFSEQELRRINPDTYPHWVPSSELHRPDGYWHVPFHGKMATIALEMEITQKRNLSYQLVATFYEQHHEIFRVVWVVPTVAFAEQIRSQIESVSPETQQIHNFLLLNDIKQHGWNAPFIVGRERGWCLKDLLHGGVPNACPTLGTLDFLNFRKTAEGSKTSADRQNHSFSE